MRTAKEQFVQDYLLVMENDADGYRDLISTAHESVDMNEFVHFLRQEWDEYVDQVARLAELEWGSDAPATLLIRQIMGGWGDSEFYEIAKSVAPFLLEQKELING